MKTIMQTETAILVQRRSGYAVSVKVKEWNALARTFFYDWKTVATGLSADAADVVFADLITA